MTTSTLAAKMHAIVLKIAIAVILTAAIFFILATSFSELEGSANATVNNMELARRTGLNKSVAYLQQ